MQEAALRQEEEMLFNDKKYSNLSEEVDQSRQIITKLRSKYKTAMTEVQDIQHEREEEREDMLENIRSMEREMAYCNQVMQMLMTKGELQKIRHKSKHVFDTNEWKVPAFYLAQAKVEFPKLGA